MQTNKLSLKGNSQSRNKHQELESVHLKIPKSKNNFVDSFNHGSVRSLSTNGSRLFPAISPHQNLFATAKLEGFEMPSLTNRRVHEYYCTQVQQHKMPEHPIQGRVRPRLLGSVREKQPEIPELPSKVALPSRNRRSVGSLQYFTAKQLTATDHSEQDNSQSSYGLGQKNSATPRAQERSLKRVLARPQRAPDKRASRQGFSKVDFDRTPQLSPARQASDITKFLQGGQNAFIDHFDQITEDSIIQFEANNLVSEPHSASLCPASGMPTQVMPTESIFEISPIKRDEEETGANFSSFLEYELDSVDKMQPMALPVLKLVASEETEEETLKSAIQELGCQVKGHPERVGVIRAMGKRFRLSSQAKQIIRSAQGTLIKARRPQARLSFSDVASK